MINAAENQNNVTSRVKVIHMRSFLAFNPVIKNFHVNGPGLFVLSFTSAQFVNNYAFFSLLNVLKTVISMYFFH